MRAPLLWLLLSGLVPSFAAPAQPSPLHDASRLHVPVGIQRAYPTRRSPLIHAFAGAEADESGGVSRTALFEMSAVALTGATHLATSEGKLSYIFIPLATAGWGAYALHQARTVPGFGDRVGFTARDLGPAFRDATLLAAAAGGLMAGYAAWQDSLYTDRAMLPPLALYPAWGLIQQFLVQGMFARNMRTLDGPFGSPLVVVPATALLFGAVHLPNRELAAATFGMGLLFTPLYLKHRNLWPLGLYHGWLGVLFYHWVLQRDPMRYLKPQPRSDRMRLHVGPGPAAAPYLTVQVRL